MPINIENLSAAERVAVRTGLGLGTAATASVADFATAAHGTKANSALQGMPDVVAAFNSATVSEKSNFRASVDGVTSSGLSVTVLPLRIGAWSFAGGSIAVPGAGTWYVGVEMWSGQLRVLSRLGHRGWVPVARAVASSSVVTTLEPLALHLPESRIPRTLNKILAGQPISVLVAGSSLTQSDGGATTWAGMVFGSGAVNRYRLPGTVNCQYRGVGASPNQYQLAQMGLATGHTAYGYTASGFTRAITNKPAPNGRSSMFDNVDLVVLGCLANGGDYRLETIEPMVRRLRKRGIEVILLTDNPQGPSTDYATMAAAGLYVDGPHVMRIADLYGVELADTAAYVFDAHLRANGTGIYGDTIHMASGAPVGASTVLPANGHEAWARAVRSIFSVGVTSQTAVVTSATYDFTSGVQSWLPWTAAGTVQSTAGALVITKTSAATGQWGAKLALSASPAAGALAAGDTIRIQGTITVGTGSVQIGLTNGSWVSNVSGTGASGSFDVLLTANATATDITFLAQPDSAAAGASITLDDVIVTATRQPTTTSFDATPGRRLVSAALPPVRVVTDFKTPADAVVILPADELALGNNDAAKGSLGAHPWGASSFARCFSSAVSATQDLLTLTTGQRLFISGDSAVGIALVHYREPADGACTIDVKVNGSVSKTLSISAVPFANEWYLPIFTPTQLAVSDAGTQASVEITVTAGTLRFAAGVVLTADVDYVLPEQITYVGTGWLPKETSRSGLPGRPTDTLNDYALLRCTGRRVYWIVSGNPGTKLAGVSSGRSRVTGANYSGNYHIRSVGGLIGDGENHTITCEQVNAAGTQADGHALHIGGAIIVNDR